VGSWVPIRGEVDYSALYAERDQGDYVIGDWKGIQVHGNLKTRNLLLGKGN